MESNVARNKASAWKNAAIVAKFDAFTSFVRLRSATPPKELLKISLGLESLATLIVGDVVLPEKSKMIFEWLADEIRDCVTLIRMADGFVEVSNEASVADEEHVKKPRFTTDVFTYSEENSLASATRRLRFALETMWLIAECKCLRDCARTSWSDVLLFANGAIDEATILEKLFDKLEIDDELVKKNLVTWKKFRENDDVYILEHGFAGYVDSLDRILQKIGGREWDIQILEVLDRKAAMIGEFKQMKYLVDVLPAVLSMIDQRIQSSLNRIFKTAFEHLQFGVKKQVLNYYYQKYQTWSTADMDKDNYGKDLNALINNLAAGGSKGSYRQVAVRFAWFFMLSVKQCWWKIATCVVTMPALVVPIVEVLRFLPPVVSLRLSDANNNRLVLEGWRRLTECKMITNEEQELAWCEFLLRACNAYPKKCLIEAKEIVEYLLPFLPVQPALALECMRMIFSDKTAIIEWRHAASVDSDEGLDPAKVFDSVFSIFARASRAGHSDTPSNLEIRTLCPKTLSALTRRWVEANVKLTSIDVESLKANFDALPWVQRIYAFWLLRDCCEKVDIVEIPSCMFEVLELPELQYCSIDCAQSFDANHDKNQCALNSMFEASCFACDLGVMFLRDGKFERFVVDTETRTRLVLSTKVALKNRSYDEWKNVVVFLREFFDKFDSSRKINDVTVREDEYHAAILFVAPVQLMSDVAIMLLNASEKSENKDEDGDLKIRMQNLYSVFRDYVSLVPDQMKSQLAKMTSLRLLWSSCVLIIKTFAKRKQQTPKQMEYLLLSIMEGFRRSNLQLEEDMIDDVEPFINTDILSRMNKEKEKPEDVTVEGEEMVFFTCGGCGEACKKNQVAKHKQMCRRSSLMTCHDCCKDFVGEEYQTHLKCVSENQKYGGSNYVEKVNKGELKQDVWVSQVQRAIDSLSVSNAGLKSLLERVRNYSNVPRKEAKFKNFVANSLREKNQRLVAEAWTAIFNAAQAERASDVEQQAKAKQEHSTNETSKMQQENGSSEKRSNDKKRKGSQEKDVESSSDENSKKKMKTVDEENSQTNQEESGDGGKQKITSIIKRLLKECETGEMKLRKLKKRVVSALSVEDEKDKERIYEKIDAKVASSSSKFIVEGKTIRLKR